MNIPRHILVATDLSRASHNAIALSGLLARRFEASVTMYSQLTSPIPSVKADGEPPSDDSAADDELARLRVEHLSSIDNVAIVRELGADASAGICNTVERLAAHLVVVGTHGRTGLRRFLIGSVAEKVVRLAPCAVMVVPTKMSRNESSVTPTNRCSSAGA